MRVGVLISGTGSNLQALIDDSGIDVACVVSSRKGAAGIERARAAAIDALVSSDEDETARFLDDHEVGLVVLAGYMRVLSPAFVHRYSGRILNLHPSLLPAFPGTHAVRDAVDHGVRVTGVTVHLIDDDHVAVDSGPIVLQEALEVSYDERPEDVAERLHEIEHRLLPRAVHLFCAGRLEVSGRRVRVKDETLA
ncbi:MAG TPA: phosphoribosylglycinamide formyltransferase [Gaiellales bacterium]|nr:phosphoribosylglycinamide formyltransferase [Gaiellales bacterium]